MTAYSDSIVAAPLRSLIGGMEATGHKAEANLDPQSVKDTIARGVEGQVLAYVGKSNSGDYEPFRFGGSFSAQDVEISDVMYIVTRETAEHYKKLKEKPPVLASLVISPNDSEIHPG